MDPTTAKVIVRVLSPKIVHGRKKLMFFVKSVKQFTKKLFRQGAKNLLAEITKKKLIIIRIIFLKRGMINRL